MDNYFFEKIEPHKAILIKLSHHHDHYEVLTIFREYQYLNKGDRKPNLYLSDLQKYNRQVIPFKEVGYDDFLLVLQKMNFTKSSKDRYELMLKGVNKSQMSCS